MLHLPTKDAVVTSCIATAGPHVVLKSSLHNHLMKYTALADTQRGAVARRLFADHMLLSTSPRCLSIPAACRLVWSRPEYLAMEPPAHYAKSLSYGSCRQYQQYDMLHRIGPCIQADKAVCMSTCVPKKWWVHMYKIRAQAAYF